MQYYEHRVMRETKPKAVSSLLGIRREDGKQNSKIIVLYLIFIYKSKFLIYFLRRI